MDSTLSKALRAFFSGPLKQLMVNMSGQDGEVWEKELGRFNRKEPCWVKKEEKAESELLSYTFFQVSSVLLWKEKFGLPFVEGHIKEMEGFAPVLALPQHHACVLVPYLHTVQNTFEFWMKVLKSTHPNSWRSPDLQSDEKHLRLLEACAPFPANTLRWEVIDLSANWTGSAEKPGTSPESVRGENSPHFGVYAVLAHNPSFAPKMNGTTVPHLWVPGLQATVDGSGTWTCVPDCDGGSGNRELSAGARRSGDRIWSYSVPVLRAVYGR